MYEFMCQCNIYGRDRLVVTW